MHTQSVVLVLTMLLGLALSHNAAVAEEKPVQITAEQLELCVAKAPDCPKAGEMGLSLELIDYIDCTDVDDPHDMMDQGTSRVVDGPAGRYRITAGHRHAFFSYRFKSAGKDKPVLIVIEYPDDDVRTINFSTHESVISGRRNIDWSLETGVYTGNPFPLSNTMKHHTFIMWPQDNWPAVLVGNFHRYGHPAAASRIWVYAITEKLPVLKIDSEIAPAHQRRLGHFNSLGWYLPTRLYFGSGSPDAVEHMLDYCQYVGVNELAWTVLSGNGYRFDCTIPAWDQKPGHGEHLDIVLESMDERPGMSFAAGFNFGADFVMGGTKVSDLSDEKFRELLLEGFREFLNRYGKFKSLRKIILGAQYGIGLTDYLQSRGLLDDVVGFIRQRRPDIQVLTFIGGRHLHEPYFSGGDEPSAGTVVGDWEASQMSFSDYLGKAADERWIAWGHDPKVLGAIDGLTLYNQYQPDDFGIFPLYAQQPRSMIYYDLDRSQARSDYIDTDYAAMWNTHFEGWYGLHPEVNFWYQKLWVAPDFNAAGDLARQAFVRTLMHRDRLAIMPGSWNFKYFGHEDEMRRFAKAYRQLPDMVMDDLPTPVGDSIKLRWAFHLGKRYVEIMNLSPFPDTVQVDETVVQLKPCDLATVVHTARRTAPTICTGINAEYGTWVSEKARRFEDLLLKLERIDPAAAGQAYADTLKRGRELIEAQHYHAADIELADGLISELQLRLDILEPPTLVAGRLILPPDDLADFSTWPRAAGSLEADTGEFLAGHLYFPLSWNGPDDLSASLRIGHDGKNLYFALKVRDSKLTEKDACSIRMSTDGAYRDWHSDSRRSNLVWSLPVPVKADSVDGVGSRGMTCTATKIEGGYIVTGSAPLKAMGLEPGDALGFLINVSDDDDLPNTFNAGWAAKQVLLAPHRPNFAYWSDARTCGRLILER